MRANTASWFPAASRGLSSMTSDCSPTLAMPSGVNCFGHASIRKPFARLHGPGKISGGRNQSGSGGEISSSISAANAACASIASPYDRCAQRFICRFMFFSAERASVARLCQNYVLQYVDVALQVRALRIAAHDLAQQRERPLEILLIDGELRERDQRVLAIQIERARALKQELGAVVIALVAVGLGERHERVGVRRVELH